MFQLLLGSGLVIFLIILLLIYKISTMVGVAKGKQDQPDSKSNHVNAVLMLLFVIISGVVTIYFSYAWYDEYELPVASEHGVKTDLLFWWTMVITGIAFVITQVLLFYFAFKYRYQKGQKASYYPDNSKLEIAWTLVPAVVLTILILYGLNVWTQITDKAPEKAETIEIMGMQFAWQTRYPGGDDQLGRYDYKLIDAGNVFGMDLADKNSFDDFTPREMHLPKGKPVLLKIRARDVLHSVFAPHFRLKMDAVPGMPTRFWFVPTKTTKEMRKQTNNPDFNYEIACAEVCGKGHFSMRYLVVVDTPEDYEKWKKSQKTWLATNPEYMAKVPEDLKEAAAIASGIEGETNSEQASF